MYCRICRQYTDEKYHRQKRHFGGDRNPVRANPDARRKMSESRKRMLARNPELLALVRRGGREMDPGEKLAIRALIGFSCSPQQDYVLCQRLNGVSVEMLAQHLATTPSEIIQVQRAGLAKLGEFVTNIVGYEKALERELSS